MRRNRFQFTFHRLAYLQRFHKLVNRLFRDFIMRARKHLQGFIRLRITLSP